MTKRLGEIVMKNKSIKRLKDDVGSELHQMLALFEFALTGLGKKVPHFYIETLSILVHEVMSARFRKYHVSAHVIEVALDLDALGILAALFHDIVYLQVDRRIHPSVAQCVSLFEVRNGYQITLPHYEEGAIDNTLELAYHIFNVKPGDVLTPVNGVNEFLSAVVATKLLSPFLDQWEILQVVACIEATIAFRGLDQNKKTVSEQLYQRLTTLEQKLKLEGRNTKLSQTLEEVVYRTVQVANRDVANFGDKNIGNFLDSTWKLILEGNPIFKNPLFTVVQYRTALEKVESFYRSLNPNVIFRHYKGMPSKSAWEELATQTRKNLINGIEYIQVKSLGLGILEAIANLSGGIGPMILFMGSVPADDRQRPYRTEQFLDPSVPTLGRKNINPIVLRLLTEGRPGPIDFDIKNSPLAAYIYERMETPALTNAIQLSKKFFKGDISSLSFLQSLPKPIVVSIMMAVSQVAWSRSDAIVNLKAQILKNE